MTKIDEIANNYAKDYAQEVFSEYPPYDYGSTARMNQYMNPNPYYRPRYAPKREVLSYDEFMNKYPNGEWINR